MPIAPKTSFDHYEILTPLGKGGMGEVYRACDNRLNRAVAIKVLPSEVAHDAERLRRFEQEARATSALNHPNILTVYDFGNYEGNPYLVMELLEGGELRAQLDESALPIRKAIEYAQQIAAGLSAAHDKGIVHRDLKPENVFITNDGRVKILDFGLAKLRPPRNVSAGSDVATAKQYTNPGTVMGTVAYMSPEQVRGQELDFRSDIFSFGIILYEMLSGQRTFTGESQVEVMNAILKEDPPELTNMKISPALDKIVRRCLEKKPELRFHSAHDLGFALSTLTTTSNSGGNRTEAIAALPTTMTKPSSGWRERFAWIGLVVVSLALLALGVAYVRRPALEAEPMRFSINAPEKATFFDWPSISPDGRTLAFVAEVDGKRQLYVRSMGATTARPLVEVRDNFPFPFWSPDSQHIAYYDLRKLKKIAVIGGAPETLCDTGNQGGGTWNREGIILFGNGPGGIHRVSANGGVSTAVTSLDTTRGDTFHTTPAFLPDGHHFLFYVMHADPAKQGIYLASLEGGETRQLVSADAWIVKVAQSSANPREGYLTFARQGALMAQAFDFSRNEVTGNPVRIAERVSAPLGLFAHYSLGENGTLVLLEKETAQRLTWVDRTGKKLGTTGPAEQFYGPSISPDGKRLAVGRLNSQLQTQDIHLFDLVGGEGTPFTFSPANDQSPVWSPEGNRIVWSSWQTGTPNLFQKTTNGAGRDELLVRSTYQLYPSSWSANGMFLAFIEVNPKTAVDIWVVPMEGEHKPWLWLNTTATETSPRISPDGKWIAYQSNESGRNEIYVQAFVPGAAASGSKRQLSTNGGSNPNWRKDGRELYYVSVDGRMMVVDITLGVELKAGTPKEIFSLQGIQTLTNAGNGYNVTGDGQRFLFVTSAEDASVPPFTVVLNWMAELKK